MTNRFRAQCIICHCTVDPGQGTRHRTGIAHLTCLGNEPQRQKGATYREPVTVHATLKDDAPIKLAAAWWDGSMDGHQQVWTWLPKSQVIDNKDGTITIPRWLQGKTGIGDKELAEREDVAC